jgi:hypothetical protein
MKFEGGATILITASRAGHSGIVQLLVIIYLNVIPFGSS